MSFYNKHILTNKNNTKKEDLEFPKSLNTYLGGKGYTIPKNELDIKLQNFIKQQLTITPFVQGAPVQSNHSFLVYRESANRLYVPRYFGEEYFGTPKEIKINLGLNINIEFVGKLRDYQEPVIESFLNYVNSHDSCAGLLELPCAWGKTSASLYILSKIQKKTLVIVHKEFLMNQWIERIQQFLPQARIGKIQGQIIDIEDKDIVLCMLQSLSMKEYPATIFDSFGLTIIDEVHHISSEVFSNALFKIVTKYMLGLSATMNRKDGTSKVFKMFLGDVVEKVTRKGDDHKLVVRAIEYKTNDEEFNETTYDYRGSPQYSTMIGKLCNFNHRTEFILKVLKDFISDETADKNEAIEYNKQMDINNPNCEICHKNNNYLMKNTCCDVIKYCMPCLDNIAFGKNIPIHQPEEGEKKTKKTTKCPYCNKLLKYEQNYIENKYVKPLEKLQTIVLSHNLNILDYMYKKIVCKNMASVGYYVGGMKENQLKNTEKKQIILATYSMAAEGLDIPSLNAEFLITPKTDIEQCIGRILRSKHKYNDPVVYDFIDSHDIFKKQWAKRKQFYKKNNYKIIGNDSIGYHTNYNKWETLNDTNKKTTCKKIQTNNNIDINDFDAILDKANGIDQSKDLPVGKCLIKLKK